MNGDKNNKNVVVRSKSLTGNPMTNRIITPEMSQIKQDLLYFKNDVLCDIRQLEEKLNLKLSEQSVVTSEQFDAYEKKLDQLTNQMTKVSSLITGTTDFSEKINEFQKFKTKAEDNFNRLNARIITIRKETKDYIESIEKIVNENLRYPGLIGNNCKFFNFRQFIDHIMKQFKDFNDFKVEIDRFDLNNFQKKVNQDISIFKYEIGESKRHSLLLISSNMKEFNSKIENIIKQNTKMMNENEEKFNDFKEKINDYLKELQSKFSLVEKNLNDKYIEQLNEIQSMKIMKNNFIQDMQKIKSNLELNKKENESKEQSNIKNYITEKINDYMSKNKIILKENNNSDNNNNNYNQKILNDIKGNSQFIIHSKGLNRESMLIGKGRNTFVNNIKINENNFSNNIINTDEKDYNTSENFINGRMNKTQIVEKSRSFEKSSLKEQYLIDENNININEKNNLGKYLLLKKEVSKNNYSITNIPKIKFKKVFLREPLNKRNRNNEIQPPISDLSENKEYRKIPNNYSPRKGVFQNMNNINKSSIDFTRINKEKMKNMKFSESSRNINANDTSKLREDLNSLMIIKKKEINNTYLRRGKNRSWSSERKVEKIDKKIQFGIIRNINEKLKVKDLILINTKTSKTNRKINL